MAWSLTRVSGPAQELVTLAQARQHLRIPESQTEDDFLVLDLIQAVREHLESRMRRTFLTTTWRLRIDAFPGQLGWQDWSPGAWSSPWAGRIVTLPRPPLQSVTEVVYSDSADVTQTLDVALYALDTDSKPGRLYLKSGASWPSVSEVPGAVQVTYIAGWTNRALVPMGIVQAILLMVAHLYENREDTVERALTAIPMGVRSFIWANRQVEVV